jgi:protein-arginine kinase activator protein McsA
MMTSKQKRSIRDMRRAGLSYGAMAETTGLSANTVKSFCRRENIGIAKTRDVENRDVCKYCGKPLSHSAGRKKKRFCDDKCRSDWWNDNRDWTRGKKAHRSVCRCCGAEFESHGNKKRKYCSRECYTADRRGEGFP